jgi:hypothetical protein
LGNDDPKLGQMATQGVDQQRALPDEALMRAERDGPRLMLGALHRDVVNVGPQHSFCDRSRLGCIVLLPLDERLHVDRRDQPDIMSVALRHAAPVVARRTGLHRHDTRGLRPQHLHQLGARHRAVE